MELFILIKGLILGFAIAAPVGPIGLLCINRTMQKGRLSGFLSGMGAASADMLYGCIAAFGLTSISNVLIKESFYIKLFGGLFLCYLGIKIFFSKSKNSLKDISSKSMLNDYISTFFLTIANPMTIVSFAAVFAGLGVIDVSNKTVNSVLLVLGVFFGSAMWWLLLSLTVEFINKKSDLRFMDSVNKVSGVVILVLGILAAFNFQTPK